jgi:hypothetical protein
MTNTRRTISRRRFVQAATGILGATGGALYVNEARALPAPLPPAVSLYQPTSPDPSSRAPILIAVNDQPGGEFSRYLGEMLRAEGILLFHEMPLSSISAAQLASYSLVILGPGEIQAAQASLLERFVAQGGALIAFRPAAQIAAICGLRATGGSASQGHQVVTDHRLAQGTERSPLQYHGTAAIYDVVGGDVLARIDGAAASPAVTLATFGRGRAAAWAYDLPRSIAFTRQGNPDLADTERDGYAGFRASELFDGWVDYDRIHVPQADEHQRLFASVVHDLTAMPLPRLWYFPAGSDSVIIATGDAHGSRAPILEDLIARAQRHNAQFSIYYSPPPISAARRIARKVRWWASEQPIIGGVFAEDSPYPTPHHVETWQAQGHEFGMHPYVEAGMEAGYNAYWNEFVKNGYGPISPTVRTHRVLWKGWVEAARIQASYGIRMNLDYYHLGPIVRRPDGAWSHGYLTGSGLPMRFVDQQGAILNVYQQHTHIVDEYLMNVFDPWVGLEAPAALDITTTLLERGIKRFPSAFGLQCHADPFTLGGQVADRVGAWFDGTLAYAAEQRIPILSAEGWLSFTESRAQALPTIAWDMTSKRLQITQPVAGAHAFELLIPQNHNGSPLVGVQVDQAEPATTMRQVGAIRYAAVRLEPGTHAIIATYRA